MGPSLFQIVNYSLILLVLIMFIRYMWDVFFDRNYQPEGWKQAIKTGAVTKTLRRLERNYPDKVRFFAWWFQVDRLRRENVSGNFAELGVYKGESARVLHHMDPLRKIHLFDTFEGFPEQDLVGEEGVAATYTKENFADTGIEKVARFLDAGDRVVFHKGHFPETASALSDEKFAMVNIDADLYLPTLSALEFFYPRMSPGGVMLIHDYNTKWMGVIRAVDEFRRSIPEEPALLPDMEGTIVIIRNK